MKTIKRILSVILTLALMMSLICVPGYAEDTKTIDLAIEFSASGDRSTPVTSVEAGTEFTMWVTFNGNPTELADSIQAYDLLIGYDSAKISFPYGTKSALAGLTAPTFNPAFVDGVMYAGWASDSGIVVGRDVQASGLLFQIDAKAEKALSAADLLDIEFIPEETNADDVKQITQLLDQSKAAFNYVQVPTLESDAKTVELAIEFSAANDRTTSVTNIAAGTEFTMWVTFDGNPTELAESIQAYDLLIGYDSAKISFPYGTKSAVAGLTSPTFNPAFANGVMYAGWANDSGIVVGRDVQASGLLFQIDAKAEKALTAADLEAIKFIAEATSADGKKQTTQLLNGSKTAFKYVQVSTVDAEAARIELAIEFSAVNNRAKPVTNIVSGTEFTMWVTFDGNPTELAESIQAYDLLIGYDSAKISFPYGTKSAVAGLTAPTFNHAFADGVMYAGWANDSGIVVGRDVQASGLLFQIDAKATATLTKADLEAIKFIAEATSADGKKQYTQLLNGYKSKLNYVQVIPEVEVVPSTTIDLSIEFTAANNRAKRLTSVAAGAEFTMWVSFDKNPTVLEESIQAYDLLISYDAAKIAFPYGKGSALAGLTSPTFNHAFAEGVMYAGWANESGIVIGRDVQASGLLFQIDAKAAAALTAEDLDAIKFIAEATSADGKKQVTQLLDGSKIAFNYVQVPPAEVEVKTIDLAIEFTEFDDRESPITSVYEGDEFTMWVTFAGNPTELEASINAYDLLISYDPDKLEFPYGDNSAIKGEYGLTTPTFNHAFADGVMYAGWAGEAGIVVGRDIQESGILFQIDVAAIADLKASDLRAMEFIADATSDIGKKQITQLLDGNNMAFGYVQIPTVEEGDEPDEPEVKEIKDSDFTFVLDDVEYTGSAIEPAVTSDTLEEGTDYEVTYSNNIEVGIATITVTGIGDYTGTVTKTFNIVAKEEPDEPDVPAGPTIDLAIEFSEEGVRANSVTSVKKGDKFTMWVTFDGNPTVAEDSIQAYDLLIGFDPAKISLPYGKQSVLAGLTSPTFNHEFANGVMYAGWASDSGIVVGRNIAASGLLFQIDVQAAADLTADDLRAIVFVAEKTNTAGVKQTTQLLDSKKTPFNYVQVPTIVEEEEPVVITDADFTLAETSVVYTGSAIKPAVTSTLTADVDYEVAYANNTNVGTATVTITGKGNYTGTVTKTFAITAKAIAEGDFTFDLADKEYTGSAIEPAVTSTLPADAYVVTYSNNVEAGTATITVTGKGNYTGTIVKTFTITAKEEPEVPAVKKGDVDGNDKVTIEDAIETLKIIAGIGSFTADQTAAADADSNGKVSIEDAIEILKMIAGLV